MRALMRILAILTIVLGGVWILQGFNLFPGRSFMNGDHKWALYGACLVLGGVVLMSWAARRDRRIDG